MTSVAAALRWCPGLVGSDDIAVLPVTPDVVLADDEPLPDRWKNYGEETRAWTITSRPATRGLAQSWPVVSR